jgi:hypothetical protein
MRSTQTNPEPPQILRGFQPLSVLWEGDAAPYRSKESAQWAVRQMRRPLAEGEALAFHCGRTMVNIEKFAEIARCQAVEKAKKRWAP